MKKMFFIGFVMCITLFARNHEVKEIKNCILFYDNGNNAVNLKYAWYSHREYYGEKDYLSLEFQTKESVDFKDTPKQIDKIINTIVHCSK